MLIGLSGISLIQTWGLLLISSPAKTACIKPARGCFQGPHSLKDSQGRSFDNKLMSHVSDELASYVLYISHSSDSYSHLAHSESPKDQPSHLPTFCPFMPLACRLCRFAKIHA